MLKILKNFTRIVWTINYPEEKVNFISTSNEMYKYLSSSPKVIKCTFFTLKNHSLFAKWI